MILVSLLLHYMHTDVDFTGTRLRGKVFIEDSKASSLPDTIPISLPPMKLELYFVGKEKIKMVRQERPISVKGVLSSHDENSANEGSVVVDENVIISKSAVLRDVDEGDFWEYMIPFEMKIPPNLPSSMSGGSTSGGSKWKIQYKIWCCVHFFDDADHTASTVADDSDDDDDSMTNMISIISAPMKHYHHHHKGGGIHHKWALCDYHNLGERSVNIVNNFHPHHAHYRAKHPDTFMDSFRVSLLDKIQLGYISVGAYLPNLKLSKGDDLGVLLAIQNDTSMDIHSIELQLREVVTMNAKKGHHVAHSTHTLITFTNENHEILDNLMNDANDMKMKLNVPDPKQYPTFLHGMITNLKEKHNNKEGSGCDDKIILPLSRMKATNDHETYRGKLIHVKYFIVVTLVTKNPFANNVQFKIPVTIH